jgi:serine O-acetyltransferase
MNIRYKELLDADWAQLLIFCDQPHAPRRWSNAFNPRFAPVVLLRTAAALEGNGYRRLAKIYSFLAYVLFGIEVPASLKIGPGFVMPHTQGTILGAGHIGSNVTIYQQVTLGAKVKDFGNNPDSRPRVLDGAILTAGAKILGPVTIGKDAIVGANAVVLSDVPDGYTAVGVPAKNRPQKSY